MPERFDWACIPSKALLRPAQAASEAARTPGVARPEVDWTAVREYRGRGVLIGAWAVAPNAGEWIHHAALAIRAEIPISTLLDDIAQFPSYTEGYLLALERLDL
ncbi:hypothetical protein [Actinomadura sp. 3N407]|uniref:hypothetical protein n=1 Tax=Actinomadura sp. 3N407 TaxID=3457423 RepID=UPI003FCE24AD